MLGNVYEWNSDIYDGEDSAKHYHKLGGSYQQRYVTSRSSEHEEMTAWNGFRVARMHPMPDPRRLQSAKSKIERVIELEDSLPLFSDRSVNSHLTKHVIARLTLGANLVSFDSIDRQLAMAPGTLRWRKNRTRIEDARNSKPIDYPARLSRFLEFARNNEADESDPTRSQRLEYAEARLAQLDGRPDKALPVFEKLIESNSERPEPLLRSLECRIAMLQKDEVERTSALEAELQEAVKRFPNCVEFWSLFIRSSLNEFGKSPCELLAKFDAMPDVIQATHHFKNGKSLVQSLHEEQTIRINCGCFDDMTIDGKIWRRDLFHFGGYYGWRSIQFDMGIISETVDPTVFSTIHSFQYETAGSYRLPIPNGDYRVSLLFCATSRGRQRLLDVAIEKQIVLQEYQPVTGGFGVAHQKQFETHVSDGQLDIDLLPLTKQNALISGIVVERISLPASSPRSN